jgi:general secretion pathway protein L
MSQLRIYLTSEWQDAASVCAWAWLDERGAVRDSGTGNLAAMPRADDCIAIVSAEQVLCVAIALPRIKARQLETALPYALEEFLLGEVTDSHVVPGAKLNSGETLLYSVNKDRLRRFVLACEGAAIRLRYAIPEYSLLPVRTGEWSVAWDGQTGLLGNGQYAGAVLGRGSERQPPAALTLKLNGASPAVSPAALRIYYKAGIPADQRAWPQWSGLQLVRDGQIWDWRNALIAADVPNLLWGKFAPPARIQEWWPKLRPALLLLLLLFLVEALGTNLEWMVLSREKQHIQRAMNGVYQDVFGAEAAVVDAPLQMRRSLARARHAAGLSDDADFLPLLDRFAAEFAALPGGRMDGVRYADGRLDVEAHLPSRSAWESLLRRLGEQGLRAQVIDVRDSGSAVDVHFRVGS